MTFKPRMTSKLEGVTLLDSLKCRSWNGVVADVWHAACGRGARGEYVSKDPRLFILLEHKKLDPEGRLGPHGVAEGAAGRRPHLQFIPAELPLWAQVDEPIRLRHLDLHFDVASLSERLGEDLDNARLATPLFDCVDERLLGLARLIAEECVSSEGRHELYGDGLIVALLIDLLGLGRSHRRSSPGLANWQLRRATDFIEENCLRSIRLEELAKLTDLSQSYFSHAFKASTGVAPSRWHMRARIRKVREMLRDDRLSLTEVAAAAGFSDQAHLTRTFRQVVGETPAAWRRMRRKA